MTIIEALSKSKNIQEPKSQFKLNRELNLHLNGLLLDK